MRTYLKSGFVFASRLAATMFAPHRPLPHARSFSTAIRRSGGPLRSSRGFTITETMVVVAILSILLIGIMTTYVLSIWGFQGLSNFTQLHASGRMAVDQFAKDVRGVNSVVSCATNAFVVTIVTNTSSGSFLTTTATYTYSSSAKTFTRTTPTMATQLATNVNNVIFTMFDQFGNPTTVANNAHEVELDLYLSNHVVNVQETEDYLAARLVLRNTPQ